MSGAGAFPFDPARLAALAALSEKSRALGAPPAFSTPVTLTDDGYIWIPNPDPENQDPEDTVGCYLHGGVRIGWAPLPEKDGLVLTVWGGFRADDGHEEEGVAVFMTRGGLKALIQDLEAIHAAAGAMTGEPS